MENQEEQGKQRGSTVAAWRIYRGITQQRLAERSGYGIHVIGKIERGERVTVDLGQLAAIATALDVSLDELMKLVQPPQTKPLARRVGRPKNKRLGVKASALIRQVEMTHEMHGLSLEMAKSIKWIEEEMKRIAGEVATMQSKMRELTPRARHQRARDAFAVGGYANPGRRVDIANLAESDVQLGLGQMDAAIQEMSKWRSPTNPGRPVSDTLRKLWGDQRRDLEGYYHGRRCGKPVRSKIRGISQFRPDRLTSVAPLVDKQELASLAIPPRMITIQHQQGDWIRIFPEGSALFAQAVAYSEEQPGTRCLLLNGISESLIPMPIHQRRGEALVKAGLMDSTELEALLHARAQRQESLRGHLFAKMHRIYDLFTHEAFRTLVFDGLPLTDEAFTRLGAPPLTHQERISVLENVLRFLDDIQRMNLASSTNYRLGRPSGW